jgi:hypothetical protein
MVGFARLHAGALMLPEGRDCVSFHLSSIDGVDSVALDMSKGRGEIDAKSHELQTVKCPSKRMNAEV